MKKQGNVDNTSFLSQNKTEVQVLCYQNLRTRRMKQGEQTGSNQSYFGPDCIYHFSPEPFLVNYAQSLSVIVHFFINSCIFLTIFHHSSGSYGNTTLQHSFLESDRSVASERQLNGAAATSVPYFPFGKHPSNWPASLIAKYFGIKNICIHDQSKAIHTI